MRQENPENPTLYHTLLDLFLRVNLLASFSLPPMTTKLCEFNFAVPCACYLRLLIFYHLRTFFITSLGEKCVCGFHVQKGSRKESHPTLLR